jgi:hypothetical protein
MVGGSRIVSRSETVGAGRRKAVPRAICTGPAPCGVLFQNRNSSRCDSPADPPVGPPTEAGLAENAAGRPLRRGRDELSKKRLLWQVALQSSLPNLYPGLLL